MRRCKHNRVLCAECVTITDSGKRLSDAISLILVTHEFDEIKDSWIAVALVDGSTDHTLYPSRATAIAHQTNEFHFSYLNLRNCIAGMSHKDAQLWLDVHRHVYDKGGRLSDPDMPDLIFPQAKESRITKPIFPIIDPIAAFRRR